LTLLKLTPFGTWFALVLLNKCIYKKAMKDCCMQITLSTGKDRFSAVFAAADQLAILNKTAQMGNNAP
jgi:hypothetical protein